ncbi:MAG: hypothetical protein NZ742_11430, partial [Acidobacteria bacterium]|nr:hypothetical protein [Acidobacteriota bacterium]MDW7985297.1 hypothetical protein [Acidobacteriota bacterium]
IYMENEVLVAFPVGAMFPSFGRSDIQKVVRPTDASLCPYDLYTKYGLFHFIDMKTLLNRHFGDLWK